MGSAGRTTSLTEDQAAWSDSTGCISNPFESDKRIFSHIIRSGFLATGFRRKLERIRSKINGTRRIPMQSISAPIFSGAIRRSDPVIPRFQQTLARILTDTIRNGSNTLISSFPTQSGSEVTAINRTQVTSHAIILYTETFDFRRHPGSHTIYNSTSHKSP